VSAFRGIEWPPPGSHFGIIDALNDQRPILGPEAAGQPEKPAVASNGRSRPRLLEWTHPLLQDDASVILL
jgi:hypothetical protein